MALNLEILSPQKIVYRGPADEVVAPSAAGEVGILPQHTHYVTLLKSGQLSYKQGDKVESLQITGGLCFVESDRLTILVDAIDEK